MTNGSRSVSAGCPMTRERRTPAPSVAAMPDTRRTTLRVCGETMTGAVKALRAMAIDVAAAELARKERREKRAVFALGTRVGDRRKVLTELIVSCRSA